jgi:DUF1365 family protein
VSGQVWHARVKPFAHAFRYRAFYLQLPLKSLARQAGPHGRLGSWIWGMNRAALISVHDRDHGDGRPLLQWAQQRLAAVGINDADGEIWLQTFPRTMGYVFKPVSFWFCERANGELRAVIAEVNNTFGERHVYVLQSDGQAIRNGATLHADKRFYVSPFFNVHGAYRFRFFKSAIGGRDMARIEYRDENGALLLTSMSGTSRALDARSALLAWISYPMHSISVIMRIHWQALRLWLKGAKLAPRPKAQGPAA